MKQLGILFPDLLPVTEPTRGPVIDTAGFAAVAIVGASGYECLCGAPLLRVAGRLVCPACDQPASPPTKAR